ncbi:Aste57867_5777 [Aphanomyces stellatus]|uniref:Aste57867_5765 protein n=1 Tax=Aphanomyces stellatus TaxID=120398 RepID=A0A485KFU2_9STRA|nr:hypothetical protein As57867_005763 [Aphanomyces stellatus]KAF0709776.1 hypothetical protein As57867_005751 [Aphanomyces stellatus]VFT82792.1 Aste57867_5765 [Aphanomyces stellatus]VFT82801.1 Aste57867_5777 [Aphanomyces stellatus]
MRILFYVCAVAAALARADTNNSTDDDDYSIEVVGGMDAPAGQYTWTAGLRNTASGRSDCAGSLIAPTWILTAAHCVHHVRYPIKFVVVGTHNLQGTTDGETIGVQRIVVHPEYRDVVDGNDAALIELVRPSTFVPIKLSKKHVAAGDLVRVFGWGGVGGGFDFVGNQSPVLKQNDFTALANADCQNRLRVNVQGLTTWVATATHLCAGGVVGQSSCEGDSGGPLVRMNVDGSSSLVGIVSFGIACAHGLPDIYGRVEGIANFIDQTSSGHEWDQVV